MEWNVYYHNFNKDKIEKFNIFKHRIFTDEIEHILKEYKLMHLDTITAKEEIRESLFYYFWAKCEWEVEVSAWVGGDAKVKIDVYHQVMMNFDRFCEYVLRCYNHE